MSRILIGGAALNHYGSSRHTDDKDYLVNIPTEAAAFLHEDDCDLINASGHPLFMEIWEAEQGNEVASVKALLDLKAFAFAQHCINRKFQKADDCEYDIKFLIRMYGSLYSCPRAKKYLTTGEYSELCKVIRSVKF